MDDGEKTITTRFTPLGVVGAICPWVSFDYHSRGKMTAC